MVEMGSYGVSQQNDGDAILGRQKLNGATLGFLLFSLIFTLASNNPLLRH